MTPAATRPEFPKFLQNKQTDGLHTLDAVAALRALPPLIAVHTAATFLGISRSAAYRYTTTRDLPTPP